MLHIPETPHMPLYGNISQLMWQKVHVSNMALKELTLKVLGLETESTAALLGML